MRPHIYYVYILTTKYHKMLYVGVTNDIVRRVSEHKSGLHEGFTKQYNIHKLVYLELFEDVSLAIAREKQIKGYPREKKNHLIESRNPEWLELDPRNGKPKLL